MSSRRVVVVNDSEDFLDAITDALTEAGYQVTGHHGDQLSADDVARLEPDLIILDLVLKRRNLDDELANGWDFLLLVRAHDRLANVPIIVCSADAGQLRRREEELRAVAKAYVLVKPFALEELENIVQMALEGSEEAAS
jgi:DNA-binding response OmpR family regulator